MLQDKIYAQQAPLDEREELRQSEVKFRGLVESSADWIWEINIEGPFAFLNCFVFSGFWPVGTTADPLPTHYLYKNL